MKYQVRLDLETVCALTDVTKERNIYAHPNPIARDIFWQRLECLFAYLRKYTDKNCRIIDVGGGSGVFLKGLAQYFERVDMIDMDACEAKFLKEHYRLDNVNIHEMNLSEFQTDTLYEAVIFADVLEHFEDLSFPLQWVRANLDIHGLLFISLPTENFLYDLGRKIVRKAKPADHYHSSRTVVGFLEENGFEIVADSFAPVYLIPIPLFQIVVLRRV